MSPVLTLLWLARLAQSTDLGWAKWSKWSPCTVTCGGGVQHQLRRCLDVYCAGPTKRLRICKTEPCLEDNDVQLECHRRGALHFSADRVPDYGWTNSLTVDSCQAVCKSLAKNEVFGLDRTLWNGAKCLRSDGQQGACLQGKCQPVGCDRVINSSLIKDKCGVCGGDGKTCQKSMFHWVETEQFSPCSCGKESKQASVSVCVNSLNLRVVPDRMCADLARPRPRLRDCPHNPCQANWTTGNWTSCSTSCGIGRQVRSVVCVDSLNPESVPIDDQYCWDQNRPESEKPCGDKPCPSWRAGAWSTCSCKSGLQERKVECRLNGTRVSSGLCPLQARPAASRACVCGTGAASADRARYAETPSFMQWSQGESMSNAVGFTDAEKAKYKPQFNTGVWSECSTTCGPGIRTRTVECVAPQGITGGLARLPDFECDGQTKPTMFQPCESKTCPDDKSANEVGKGPFRWDYGEWGPCSASCLGGKQKSTLKCMDIGRNLAVPWSNCRAKQRPVDLTRTCNPEPCPPTWESVEFSACSHSCGGGIRTRRVRCTRQVNQEGSSDSVLILPDAQCPLPKPADQEPCGLVDCPYSWRVEQWSPCSRSCGQGEQHRQVVCEKRDASGIVHSFNPSLPCAGLQRPPTLQICNQGSCALDYNLYNFNTFNRPQALQAEQSRDETNRVRDRLKQSTSAKHYSTTFDQTHPEHRRLTLNVGGFANLYEGTSIKVKCPVKNFEKQNIFWTKDGSKIKNSAHMKISGNGALRIFHARLEDAGLYACFADGVQGNVTLKFKPRMRGGASESGDLSELKTPNDVDEQLLKKVRDSLYRLGEVKAYDKVKHIREPGRLKVDYQIGDWSVCTQQVCNDIEGSQVRLLRCRLVVEGVVAYLNEEICDSFGVERPRASRACKRTDCPRWDASDWSECPLARCTRDGISISKRQVRCVHPNGTEADHGLCDRKSRPKIKKECMNLNCTAEWRTSVWGKCSKQCDDGGVQGRPRQLSAWISPGSATFSASSTRVMKRGSAPNAV